MTQEVNTMGQKTDDAVDKEQQSGAASDVDTEALEKSWSDSIENLRKSVTSADDSNRRPLKKGGKAEMDDEEDDDDNGEYENEEEKEEGSPPNKRGGKKKVKKSLADYVAEDSEAEVAMDIEPYLKSLAVGIDKVMEDKTSTLEKAVQDLTGLVKTLGKAVVADAEMIKSLQGKLDKIGQVPIPSASRLSKSQGDRFGGDGNPPEGTPVSKDQVMRKAVELCSAGKLSTVQVTALESRLNKGLGIPENIQPLFKEEKEGK